MGPISPSGRFESTAPAPSGFCARTMSVPPQVGGRELHAPIVRRRPGGQQRTRPLVGGTFGPHPGPVPGGPAPAQALGPARAWDTMVDRPLWLLQVEDPAAAGAGGEPAGGLTTATVQHSPGP